MKITQEETNKAVIHWLKGIIIQIEDGELQPTECSFNLDWFPEPGSFICDFIDPKLMGKVLNIYFKVGIPKEDKEDDWPILVRG